MFPWMSVRLPSCLRQFFKTTLSFSGEWTFSIAAIGGGNPRHSKEEVAGQL